MKKLMILTAAMAVMGGAALADDDDEVEAPKLTQVMKMGDTAMTCEQLLTEAAAMETILGGSPQAGLATGEVLAGAGTGLAQQAAIMGGAGRAAGAIGAVGGLLGKSAKKKKEEEAAQQVIAEKRWIYMVGLYNGRNCAAAPTVTTGN